MIPRVTRMRMKAFRVSLKKVLHPTPLKNENPHVVMFLIYFVVMLFYLPQMSKSERKKNFSCLFHEISTFPQIKRNWALWKHFAPNLERGRIDIFDKIVYISGKVFQNLDMCQNFI